MSTQEKPIRATDVLLKPKYRTQLKRLAEMRMCCPTLPTREFEGRRLFDAEIKLLQNNKLEMCN